MITALTLLALTAEPEFKKVDDRDGITIESRPVEGSSFVELRVTTTTTHGVRTLCDLAYGTGKFDSEEPNLKTRTIISETENERVTYDTISPPVVSNRDYAVRARRIPSEDGKSCRMTFEAANEFAPKLPDGFVRITKLRGSWDFTTEPDGKTKITYLIFSDPGGAIPAFMVEGNRRTFAVKWIKLMLQRAKD